jgi:hypothetical protein
MDPRVPGAGLCALDKPFTPADRAERARGLSARDGAPFAFAGRPRIHDPNPPARAPREHGPTRARIAALTKAIHMLLPKSLRTKLDDVRANAPAGKARYALLLWLLGVPLPVILIIWAVKGCV